MSDADRIQQLENVIKELQNRVTNLEVFLEQDSSGSGKGLHEVVYEALDLAKRRGFDSPWQDR